MKIQSFQDRSVSSGRSDRLKHDQVLNLINAYELQALDCYPDLDEDNHLIERTSEEYLTEVLHYYFSNYSYAQQVIDKKPIYKENKALINRMSKLSSELEGLLTGLHDHTIRELNMNYDHATSVHNYIENFKVLNNILTVTNKNLSSGKAGRPEKTKPLKSLASNLAEFYERHKKSKLKKHKYYFILECFKLHDIREVTDLADPIEKIKNMLKNN